MNESLVRWTLLNNIDYLSKSLNFDIASKRGQEITTDYGRIDFVVEDYQKKQLIVELETILDNKNKLDYCFHQILNYKNVSFSDKTEYCILYASETKQRSRIKIDNFGEDNNVLVRSYSINEVKNLYTKTVEKLSLSFGLALPSPKNYTISYLRWLNKIMRPFYDYSKDILTENELAYYFTSPKTTNFKCYLKLALDFEMIESDGNSYVITQNGRDYIDNFNIDIESASNLPSVDLTNEQKKILLRVITNGNWTAHKVNFYWFLRFMEVTNGEWLPNIKDFADLKLDLANGLFGVNYKKRTMYEFLNFACNWCIELGLVERIKSDSNYDKIYLTPLGVEINNIFSLDLQIKKSRLNLSFKYLE
ncbi:hypothetical protein B1H10_03205 [candidate division KSB1 bacterium 4484_188]|nr:MAG: hypothetical protein B1H10_03205 [candidate division KSB1 bacterium 4484_188]